MHATREDLEAKWGPKLVATVADGDGNRSPTGIAARIAAALDYATTEIDDSVTVPDPAPKIVRHVAVALAMGWMNGRQKKGKDEKDDTGTVLNGELEWAEAKLALWRTNGLPDADPTTSPAAGIGSVSVVTRGRCGTC